MLNRLLHSAAFQNPEVLQGSDDAAFHIRQTTCHCLRPGFPQHVALPRGCLPEVIALLETHRVQPEVRDERFAGTPIDVEFQGELRRPQVEAVSKITEHDEGVLCAPTAFGKAAVAAWLIAKRKVNTLVLVHRQQLLDQWHERLAMFLDLPTKSIGVCGYCGDPEPASQRGGQGFCRRVRSGDCGRVPPHLRVHLRAGYEASEGQVRCWPHGNAYTKRRSSSDDLHAVRPGTVQHERPYVDRDNPVRT